MSEIADIYKIDPQSFENPEAQDDGKYKVAQGIYDGIVVGFHVKKCVYEGKENGVNCTLIWQLNNDAGATCTLEGKRWKISSYEGANFRKDLSSWFKTADWGKIVKLLEQNKIYDSKSGQINMENFIGKRATLMVSEELAKNGKSYPRIVSLSPAKKDAAVITGNVPQWMFRDAIDYKLMQGVEIHNAAAATSGEADAAPAASSGQPNAAAAGIPDNAEDLDSTLPF